MKTVLNKTGNWFLVGAGFLLCLLGFRMAQYFYEFPVLPGLLTITVWRDAVAFSLIAVAGAALTVWGALRLTGRSRKSS